MAMPTVLPTLNLNFAKARALDNRVTFTRASVATYFGADGLLHTAAANVPRFYHDETTGESLGLFLEPASTNLLLWSDDVSNAVYLKSNCTVATTTTAPDGTNTGRVVSRTATGNHFLVQTATIAAPANNWYTYSVWLKAGTMTGDIVLRMRNVAGTPVEFATAAITPTSVWARYSVSGLCPAGSPANVNVFIDPANDVGSAGDTFMVWNQQLELGGQMSSAIQTTTAQVARAADVPAMTGTNFSSWFRADEFTILAKQTAWSTNQNASVLVTGISLNDGTANNLVTLNFSSLSGANNFGGYVYSGASLLLDVTRASISVRVPVFHGLSIKAGAASYSRNGSAVQTFTPANVPSLNRIDLFSGQSPIILSRLAFIPKRVADAELQSLTAYS